MARLSGTLALVAVVLGRGASDLEAKVSLAGLTYVGNHGVEYLTRNSLVYVEGRMSTLKGYDGRDILSCFEMCMSLQ